VSCGLSGGICPGSRVIAIVVLACAFSVGVPAVLAVLTLGIKMPALSVVAVGANDNFVCCGPGKPVRSCAIGNLSLLSFHAALRRRVFPICIGGFSLCSWCLSHHCCPRSFGTLQCVTARAGLSRTNVELYYMRTCTSFVF
jgi:hypothetical protein